MEFLSFIFVIGALIQIIAVGYVLHIIAGLMIGGLISYLILKKTNNKIKSFLIGVFMATFIGFLKEVIDPSIGRHRDRIDIVYTIIGGIVGSGTTILLNKKLIK